LQSYCCCEHRPIWFWVPLLQEFHLRVSALLLWLLASSNHHGLLFASIGLCYFFLCISSFHTVSSFIPIFFPWVPQPFPRLAPAPNVIFIPLFFVLLIPSHSVRFDYLVGNSSQRLQRFLYPIVSLSIFISVFLTIKRHFFSFNIFSHFRFPVLDMREIQDFC
jgi:hypothetical protein